MRSLASMMSWKCRAGRRLAMAILLSLGALGLQAQPFQGDNLPELPRMRPPPGPEGTRLRIRSRLKPAGAKLKFRHLERAGLQAAAPPRRSVRMPPTPLGTQSPGGFVLSHAFYGPSAYADPAVPKDAQMGLSNALSFWPPLDAGLQSFLARRGGSAIFTMAGATRADGLSAATIERERRAMADLRRARGVSVLWNLMDEWDQAGGRWVAAGRPQYRGLTRKQASAAFTRYYLDESPPLGTYLRQTPEKRGCPLLAQTDFAVHAWYAFEMGADVCLLERGNDELADTSTGIAFVRGASRQLGKSWGIDLSLWRTGNASATQFDGKGGLVGGWSPSFVKRQLYLAFLSGAQILQMEPAIYFDERGRPNPLAQVAQSFADFALRRHPDVGRPDVSMAILLPHDSGFDPKHWTHCQAEAVWYGDIPYSDGDRMVDRFLRVAYPNHWLHGLAPGAPFASASGAPDPAKFKEYLAAGGDPRPFEPMGTTRWGDNLDVITDHASLEALRAFKVVALVGDVALDGRLRRALRAWVMGGGTLVANAEQVSAADEPLLGVRLTAARRSGNSATWLPDGTARSEPRFTYSQVVPTTAGILATSGEGDPLITSNAVGRGRVVLTTPSYLLSDSRDQLLRTGIHLFDWLQAAHAAAEVRGEPIEYLVNRGAGRTLVALINNSGAVWKGEVILRAPPAALAVKEYTQDAEMAFERREGRAFVPAQVPPYDLRVIAMEPR
jgi:hypothetical protein